MNHRFCVAPMMDKTDRHERYLLRTITNESLLYTEMIHANAVIQGDTASLLKYHPNEHPLAIQLGGSDPDILAEAAKISELLGYKEVNLNVGCPSNKVQKGEFGAILMKQPKLVAKCIKKIKKSISIPVTVKCRIGVDDMDEKKDLNFFIKVVNNEGCDAFIIHARKAWLNGLSPKENREIPPLNYNRVYRLKDKFQKVKIIINGGITTLDQCKKHLSFVDGVMMGREAYTNPYILENVDRDLFGKKKQKKSREDILIEYLPYLKKEYENGTKLSLITKHLFGLFKGIHGSKEIRKFLAGIDLVQDPIGQFEKVIIGYNK